MSFICLDPYIVYRNYLAVKHHFTEGLNYDAIEHRFRTRTSVEAFQKRSDKYYFTKIGKKHKSEKSIRNFFIANYVYNKIIEREGDWILNFDTREADVIFGKYLLMEESFTYTFKADTILLRDQYIASDCFENGPLWRLFYEKEKGSDYPMAVNLVLQKRINLETIIVLNRLNIIDNTGKQKIFDVINRTIKGEIGGNTPTTPTTQTEPSLKNVTWDKLYFKLKQYSRVMNPKLINLDKASEIFTSIFAKEIRKTQ